MRFVRGCFAPAREPTSVRGACRLVRAVSLATVFPGALALGLSACGDTPAPSLDEGTDDGGDEAETSAEASTSESGTGGGEGSDQDGGEAPLCTAQAEAMDLGDEGEFLARDTLVTGVREHCTAAWHALAGAEASTLRITLESWNAPGPAHLRFDDPMQEGLSDWIELAPGDSIDVTLQTTGETLIRLEPDDPIGDANDYSLRVECRFGCTKPYTRYPVMFMHGMAGTDAYLDALTYWYQLEDHLTVAGFQVYMPAVDAFETTEVRTQQWLEHLDALSDEGVARRFNLVAHSQGGIDARYLTSVLDERARIASVLTVATPHYGTSIADLATGVFDAFSVDTNTLNSIVSALAGLVGLEGADLIGQTEGFSTAAMEAFNEEVLDLPEVYYSSWSGRSCGNTELGCQNENEGERIDPLLNPTYQFLKQAEGDNDGIVGVDSGKWGEWQGTIPADHFDEVGQIADGNNAAFDHKAFYLGELVRLGERGL